VKQQRASFFKNGSWFVMSLLSLAVLGSGLTVWNYSQHVFSTSKAHVVTSDGKIAATFSERLTKKMFLHEVARVTFENNGNPTPFRAEIIFLGKKEVTLQLLSQAPLNLHPGVGCSVTVDATIPQEE
jgi:hypothetical protein